MLCTVASCVNAQRRGFIRVLSDVTAREALTHVTAPRRYRSRTARIRLKLQNKSWKQNYALISAGVSAIVAILHGILSPANEWIQVSIQDNVNLMRRGAKLGVRAFILKEHAHDVVR